MIFDGGEMGSTVWDWEVEITGWTP